MISIDERLTRLTNRLGHISNKIDKIILELAVTTQTSGGYYAAKRIELTKYFRAINNSFVNWTTKNSEAYYLAKLKEQVRNIKSKKTLINVNSSFVQVAHNQRANQNLNSLVSQSIADFSQSLAAGQKRVNTLLYITQQVNIREDQLKKALSDSILGGQIDINRSQKVLQEALLKKAKDGKYILVIDKNGREMNWKVETYSELVARTNLRAVQTSAAIATAANAETDLIQVSSHNTTTELCQHYEGKIFSLTGQTKEFPIADALPPYHPNCKHVIVPTFTELLEVNGTYQEFVDFSNNITDVHPTRTSHIPVSQRKK